MHSKTYREGGRSSSNGRVLYQVAAFLDRPLFRHPVPIPAYTSHEYTTEYPRTAPILPPHCAYRLRPIRGRPKNVRAAAAHAPRRGRDNRRRSAPAVLVSEDRHGAAVMHRSRWSHTRKVTIAALPLSGSFPDRIPTGWWTQSARGACPWRTAGTSEKWTALNGRSVERQIG